MRALKTTGTAGAIGSLLLSGVAHATPGGVDASGCHKPKNAGVHCHPEREKTPTVGHETVAQRDKRLTRECRGRPNAGACLGYAK